MISVLIPTYNYNAFSLVSILHKQLENEKVAFEIICLDDGSKKFHSENQNINNLTNASYTILEKNIGRSAIRNLLAKKATFENLLFLDSDTIPVNKNFIATYLSEIDTDEKAVYGGVKYQEAKPSKELVFRWIYGKTRESLSAEERKKNQYLCFLTNCFLIKKSVFEQIKFDENLKNWGHEDTLFSYNLQQKKIKILHIENPVFHEGLENTATFLSKTEEALKGLIYLTENGLIDPNYVKLSKSYDWLQKYGLIGFYKLFFKAIKNFSLKQFESKNPSLFLFDLYRLGLFCNLKSK